MARGLRIKGWVKEFESKRKKPTQLTRWRNLNNSNNVEVSRQKFTEERGFKWFVDIITNKGTKSKEFNTKQEAIKFAIKYMKSHPEG